jgi:hypothetical protein
MNLVSRLKPTLALAIMLTLQVPFFLEPLYNSGADAKSRVARWQVLEQSPALLTELFTRRLIPAPEAARGQAVARPDDVGPTRPELYLVALALLVAMHGWGSALGRWTRPTDLPALDRFLLDFGLGAIALSLAAFGLSLAGLMNGWLWIAIGLVGPALALWFDGLSWFIGNRRPARPPVASSGRRAVGPVTLAAGGHADRGETPSTGAERLVPVLVVAASAPFVLLMLLGAGLPTTDFDALAYHLLGPKEWFLAGRMSFLEHNVYTTFPFLAEMFPLVGMVLTGDWYHGALVGQITAAAFAPIGAMAAGRIGARTFGGSAGWLAAGLWLTTPWCYRLAVIPYVEGPMLTFATLGVLALVSGPAVGRRAVTIGLMGGAAMACKYPGLVNVLLPLALAAGWRAWRMPVGMAVTDAALSQAPGTSPGPTAPTGRVPSGAMRAASTLLLVGFGAALAVGPWLVRNLFWTGNPVYPLAGALFPSEFWPADLAAKFHAGHRSTDFSLGSFRDQVEILFWKSDWQHGLFLAWLPLLALDFRRARSWFGLLLFGAWLFLAFWGLTHRLDRFFLTIEPLLAILAAGAAMTVPTLGGRWPALALFTIHAVCNLAYVSTPLCGPNDFAASVAARRQLALNFTPAVRVINELPDHGGAAAGSAGAAPSRVLVLGEGALFDARRPVVYATVFNRSPFERLVHGPERSNERRAPSDIAMSLAAERIEWIVVDWKWVRDYRAPGNYGYSAAVDPVEFRRLEEAGVLVLDRAAAEGRLEVWRVLSPTPGRAEVRP